MELTTVEATTSAIEIPQHLSPHVIGEGSRVGEGVIFEGPVTIGERSILKGDIRLGGHCEILDDVRINGHVRFGSGCKVGNDVRIQGRVVLGHSCKLDSQVFISGPVEAGYSNTFDIRCFVGKVDERLGGHIQIGNNCFFAASSVLFQPRGKLLPTWRQSGTADAENLSPSVTSIGDGVFVSLGCGVSHDCVVEDNVSIGGYTSGYCHLMKGVRIAPQSILHQFTTLGPGAFVTMCIKVAADQLPHTVLNAHGRCLVDIVGLSRMGVEVDDARELEDFYRRHFMQPAATYLRDLPEEALLEIRGKWFERDIRDFLDVRNTMRDMRPLQLVTVTEEIAPRPPAGPAG